MTWLFEKIEKFINFHKTLNLRSKLCSKVNGIPALCNVTQWISNAMHAFKSVAWGLVFDPLLEIGSFFDRQLYYLEDNQWLASHIVLYPKQALLDLGKHRNEMLSWNSHHLIDFQPLSLLKNEFKEKVVQLFEEMFKIIVKSNFLKKLFRQLFGNSERCKFKSLTCLNQ